MQNRRRLILLCQALVVISLLSCVVFLGEGDEDATPPEGGMSGDINQTGGTIPPMGAAGAGFSAHVRDGEHGNLGSYPEGLVAVGNRLYFAADDGVHGRELWQYQRAGGVSLVADIRKGPNMSSDPKNLTRVGTHLFFTAEDSDGARVLWFLGKNGTTTVQDGVERSFDNVDVFIGLQKHLIFFENLGGNSWDAWQVGIDGSPAKPLLGWNGGNKPEVIAVAKSFAILQEIGHANQLFSCNANSIIEISRLRLHRYKTEFAEMGEELFFSGEDVYGHELWSFSPTLK